MNEMAFENRLGKTTLKGGCSGPNNDPINETYNYW